MSPVVSAATAPGRAGADNPEAVELDGRAITILVPTKLIPVAAVCSTSRRNG